MALRILHVVTAMNRGGLETWLMHVLRNIDRSQYAFDFLVQVSYEGGFDREIRERGALVIHCPPGRNLAAFAVAFAKALRNFGPYDIVHSHVHHFSGVVALLSRMCGVKAVIAHSHNTPYGDRSKLSLLTRAYLMSMEGLMARFAKLGLACSHEAGVDLFQNKWQKAETHRVLHCGLDFSRFDALKPRANAGGPKLLVHVGRFTPQKNQVFLVDVVAELACERSDFKLLFVGTGAQAAEVRERAVARGVESLIAFLGDRDDVPEILFTSDVFLFPSKYEGLGLAFVEAQAAGLRCIVSEAVPREAVVIPDLVSQVPLNDGAEAWAEKIDAALEAPATDRTRALQIVKESSFSLANCIDGLGAVYNRLVQEAR